MEEEQEQSKLAELYPHSIELTKGQKGGYGWTIKIRFPGGAPEPQKMANAVRDVDAELRKTFKDEAGK